MGNCFFKDIQDEFVSSETPPGKQLAPRLSHVEHLENLIRIMMDLGRSISFQNRPFLRAAIVCVIR